MAKLLSYYRNRKRRSRSLAWSWLISYILILLLPIATSMFVYASYQRVIRAEISRSNDMVLDLTKQSIDQTFTDLKSIGYQLTLNQRHMRFANVYGDVKTSDRMNLHELTKNLAGYAATRGFGGRVYTYYENTNSFVGASSFYSANEFYKLILERPGMTQEYWDSLLDSPKNHHLVSLGDGKPGSQPILFIHSLQNYEISTTQTLIAILDAGRLPWPPSHLLEPEAATSLVIRGSDGSILTVLGELEPSAEALSQLASLTASEELVLDDVSYMVSVVESDSIDASYIALTPSNIYWESASRIATLILVVSVASLVLGIVLILIIVKRQYSPVENLIDYINTQDLKLEEMHSNELDFIKASMEIVLKRKNTMEDRLESQNLQLRQNIMNRLLHGTISMDALAQHDFPTLDLVFPNKYFSIVVFYLDNYGDDLPLAQFILRNVFEELISEDYPTYTTGIDNLMVSVVNHTHSQAQEIGERLAPHLEQTISVLEEHFDFVLRSVISTPVNDLEGWANAYHQATASLTASLAVSDPPTHHFIAESDSDLEMQDGTLQQKMQNFLRVYDYKQVAQLIDETLTPTYAAKVNQEQWRHLHYTVLVTLVNGVDSEAHEQLMAANPFLELDHLLHDQRDCRPYFRELLKDLPEPEAPQENRAEIMANELDEYIDANYRDNTLNLNELGEVFHMTPTYLARLYKEAREETLLDALNLRRIEAAKIMLLDEQEMTVAEIAEACGFTNVNTFIRVFKKREGLTPGRYRGQ